MPLVLGPILVGLLPIIAALVLLGLSQAATSQHGSSNSGSFWSVIKSQFYLDKVGGWAADFLRWIASHFAAGQLRVLARWFTGLGTLASGLLVTNPAALEAIVHAIERVVHRGDPKARHKAASANTKAVHASHAAARANTHAAHVGHSLTKYKAHNEPRVHHATHAVDITLPHEIAGVRRREEALSRDQAKLRERTTALERGAEKTFEWIRSHPLSGVTAVFTGAVAIALARMGFGFLRCRNWQNLGRRLTCGMGKWLLDALEAVAAFALAYLAILKPEVLAEEAVKAVDDIQFVLDQILSD